MAGIMQAAGGSGESSQETRKSNESAASSGSAELNKYVPADHSPDAPKESDDDRRRRVDEEDNAQGNTPVGK
jgi:hypothetical protein